MSSREVGKVSESTEDLIGQVPEPPSIVADLHRAQWKVTPFRNKGRTFSIEAMRSCPSLMRSVVKVARVISVVVAVMGSMVGWTRLDQGQGRGGGLRLMPYEC